MENAAGKLLESATVKTLHANNFSRASDGATKVLADILARYLSLLALSSAKYASHAGRTTLTPHDALAALNDLGIAVDELAQYCSTEAKDLGRYASHSTRRLEDLHEFKVQLATGQRQDRDDAIILDFMPYNEEDASDSDEDEDEDETAMVVDSPLVLSPISVSSELDPSRTKRPRTLSWKPPEHVPSFLPPFPTTEHPPPPSPLDLPESQSTTELMPPPPDPKQPIVPVTQAMTASSASASDYLIQVPYSQSSLSSVPEYHLPTRPPSRGAHRKTSTTNPATSPAITLQTEPALFKAYHHILTHRPPATPPPSTLSRHKICMAFLAQSQNAPRWDAADTLFSTVAPCPPRVAVIGPSYPTPISTDTKDTKDKDFRFPPTIPRPVSTTERLTPLLGQQSNRIPELTRQVLPPVVMNRLTRLAHPPVLHRGTKPVIYGRGIPAPWNSHALPTQDTSNAIPPTPTSSKDKDKDKDREGGGNGGEAPVKPLLPDAQLFATWEFEPKDYKLPLPSATVVGGGGVGQRHRTSSRVTSLVVQPPSSTGGRPKPGSKLG